jgi:hypothetical protein
MKVLISIAINDQPLQCGCILLDSQLRLVARDGHAGQRCHPPRLR